MDKEEFKFMFQYMPKSELDKFKQLMESTMLAIKINDSPEFIQEAIDNFIKKYPFTKKYFDKILNRCK